MSSEAIAAEIKSIEELAGQGRFQEAETRCGDVVQRAPEAHQGWAWLGVLSLLQGRWQEAEAAIRQAISLWDQDGDYWSNLCLALRQQSKLTEAEPCARRAVAIDPSRAHFWTLLGACLSDRGQFAEAATALDRALACDPNQAAAWKQLAIVEQRRGRPSAALIAYEQAIHFNPGDIESLAHYGLVLVQRGKVARGLEILRELVEKAPRSAVAWHMLGNAHRLLGDFSQAVAAMRQAVQRAPQQRDLRQGLALALLACSSLTEALEIAGELVREAPEDAEVWLLLGSVQSVLAEPDEAIASLQKSMSLAPRQVTHSKLLFTWQYTETATAESLCALHREWDAAHARDWLPQAAAGAHQGSDPPRIGFVASDFARGPTGFLALQAVEKLRGLGFSVVCYADGSAEDDYTARFRAASDLWRSTRGRTDEELAAQIRQDHINVLFDLSGHVGSRLPVFARKPAPIQITWLGYVGTTGLAAMDYILADSQHIPADEDGWYTEKVLRMPGDYICYSPPADAPDVGPLPALEADVFTFGCFNIPAKYSPGVLATWAEILRRVPQSRLLLKNFALADHGLCDRLRGRFAGLGIEPERICLEGPSSQIDTMAAYRRVDLALDTQPYSGGLTTCEALWMGVPVVTCPGKTFASRHATSHTLNAGLSSFAVRPVEYLETAVMWPARLNELAALRGLLRHQVRNSALCDGQAFAVELANKLREIMQ